MNVDRLRLGLTALIVTFPSNADVLLDTGAGYHGGYALSLQQFVAIQIEPERNQLITGFEGFIGVSNPGTVTVVLYADGDGIPDTALHWTTFAADESEPRWLGVSGLDWEVSPGKYWLAFEVYEAGFSGALGGAKEPGAVGAYYIAQRQEWRSMERERSYIGVRVFSTPVSTDQLH